MNQLMHWFSMGGYSTYVWSSYGVVFVVLVWNALGCGRQKKRTENCLAHGLNRRVYDESSPEKKTVVHRIYYQHLDRCNVFDVVCAPAKH